jgi:hypothetical protein
MISLLNKDDDIHRFLRFEFKYGGIKKDGFDIIGLVIICADLSIWWLLIALIILVWDSFPNNIAICGIVILGSSFLFFVSEWSYLFFFEFTRSTSSVNSIRLSRL